MKSPSQDPQAEVQNTAPAPRLCKRVALMLGSFLFFFLLLEIAYQRVDPYPYFPPWQINRNEHGNLTEYDAELGWRGTPNAERVFVTQNAQVTLRHNENGHRDARETARRAGAPAIVFLGDSFTWGYDVEYDEMFANHVRADSPDAEIFNFGHRGYGTDQSLLIFDAWKSERPLKKVFLMFYENDLADNALNIRSRKNKPQYLIRNGQLVLTNVPVPPNRAVWERGQAAQVNVTPSTTDRLRTILFKSHLLHALRHRFASTDSPVDKSVITPEELPDDAWEVTRQIIHRINTTTIARGGTLCVVRIPSKGEMLNPDAYTAFGRELTRITQEKDIGYIDLKTTLDATPLRTYYRDGIHWTPHGHEIVAETLLNYLRQNGS